MLRQVLAKYWWIVLLRGIAAIVFGTLVIVWPNLAVEVFVAFFGAYVLVDGIFTIAAAFRGNDRDRFWHIAQGVLGILIGLVAWFFPGLTAITLLYFIGAWAFVTGVMQIIAAIQLRKQITNEFLLILGGVLSALFGILCWVRPGESALALATVIGIFAIIFGVVLVALSLRLRSLPKDGPLLGGRPAPRGA